MSLQLSRSDLQLLLSEAHRAARRLVRRIRLPWHQLEDLRQDLLVDLLERLPAFDARRGTLGAFAGKILTHKAARLAKGIRRERLFGAVPISLDEPAASSECGEPRGHLLPEDQGLAAHLGQPTDAFARIERRLDLERALGALNGGDLRLCAELCDATTDCLAAQGRAPRSSLYRRVKRIRLELMTAGLAVA
jgi:RNA polymerase sigma-70 factor (ECF subfamily)